MLTIHDFCCEADRIKQMNVGSKTRVVEVGKLIGAFKAFIFSSLKEGIIDRDEFEFIYLYSTEGLDWDNFSDKFDAFTDYLEFYLECKDFLDKKD